MPPRSPRPLRKVNLNLFADNVDTMIRLHGHGWSERLRDLLDNHCAMIRNTREPFLDGDFDVD